MDLARGEHRPEGGSWRPEPALDTRGLAEIAHRRNEPVIAQEGDLLDERFEEATQFVRLAVASRDQERAEPVGMPVVAAQRNALVEQPLDGRPRQRRCDVSRPPAGRRGCSRAAARAHRRPSGRTGGLRGADWRARRGARRGSGGRAAGSGCRPARPQPAAAATDLGQSLPHRGPAASRTIGKQRAERPATENVVDDRGVRDALLGRLEQIVTPLADIAHEQEVEGLDVLRAGQAAAPNTVRRTRPCGP